MQQGLKEKQRELTTWMTGCPPKQEAVIIGLHFLSQIHAGTKYVIAVVRNMTLIVKSCTS